MSERNLWKRLSLYGAIGASRLATAGLRLIKRGGTSLPGKIALTLCPDIVEALSDRFVIYMITGTNGKTTTSRIAASMLEAGGIRFMTNKSGANLSSGITATLTGAVSLFGKPRVPSLLLETDEAAFRTLAPKLKPHTVIVTNFFRDQLDRYGELYTTLNHVREGIKGTPDTRLLLNADDSLCASLGKDVPNPVSYFGFAEGAYPQGDAAVSSDAAFCLYCKTRYNYTDVTFGHLGHFQCPGCGYERPWSQVECTAVTDYDNESSVAALVLKAPRLKSPGSGGETDSSPLESKPEEANEEQALTVRLALPGLYNIYNALAGASFGQVLALDSSRIIHALENFECGFGRMEAIEVENRKLRVILVKNPTGFNQVLGYLKTQTEPCVVALAINDNLADGTDISWLWDVDFEILAAMEEKVRLFAVSGIRAEDMALRLKYAGVSPQRIAVFRPFDSFIDRSLKAAGEQESVYLLPTYTAMLDIRSTLKERYNLKNFWQ